MKSSVDQRCSDLLTKEENELILRLLGNKCQSLATGVVQLFLTQAPDHLQWVKKDSGVMCFVKDNYRRNYFFRLYCVNRGIIWEQELYNNLEYISYNEYFHYFEADDCMAAFNFANEQEASDLRKVVHEKLQMKRQRREERKSRNSLQGKVPQSRQVPNKPSFQSNTSLNNDTFGQQNQQIILNNQQVPKNKKRRHLTKADIGLPSDFKHVSHVGWDPNKGFDIDNVEDPQLKQFFNKAGVSDKQLRDRDTREFIYDFIHKHGGLDAVKSEVVEQIVPKKGPYPLPKTPNESVPSNPPPVPARTTVNRSAPPPPPGKTRPPPIVRGQPPPRPNNIPKAPEPPPISNAPAPPPPPPISGLLSPPAPPLPSFAEIATPLTETAPVSQGNDMRSALLESIKAGKALKPVEPIERKTSVGDSRGDLLSAIRQGIELKPVSNTPRPSGPGVTSNSLADALSEALKNRALAIHSDSESSSEDEDDWD